MNPIRILATALASVCMLAATGADPMATNYTMQQCEGTLTPYVAPDHAYAYPDSLVPVFINHVGRHGARYPASSANTLKLARALAKADSLGTITPLGRKLKALTATVAEKSENRWGALDSLGMAEQQGLATRMFYNFTEVFGKGAIVEAMSTYSPRAMMSMYSFTHQLDRLNNHLTFTTTTGRINSPLLRFFDIAPDYLEYRKNKVWAPPYDKYFSETVPTAPIVRALGKDYPFGGDAEAQDLALTEYYVVAGLQAMMLPRQMSVYFTPEEANALWSVFNLRQYLQRTANTLSTVPADIASDLVNNLVETTEAFVTGQNPGVTAVLRFAHAETLMPLLSLLRFPGCYYLTNYFDTVGRNWLDFDIVPMAANVQFILFRAKGSGNYYMRIDLNERPVNLRKGDNATIYPWPEVRRYLNNCIPAYK